MTAPATPWGSGVFTDKAYFVAGASSGIGRQIALDLGAAGARVALMSRREEALQEVAARVRELGGTAFVAPADIADKDRVDHAVTGAVDALGPLHGAVNCTVYGASQVFLTEQTEAEFGQSLDINLVGSMRLCQAVLPSMAERGRGSIVLMSSILGRRGIPANTTYCAAKFGLNGFMHALSKEVGPHGVRVNTLLPGLVETPATQADSPYATDFISSLARNHGITGLTWERYVSSSVRATALRRLLAPSDVSQTALFLLSDLAAGITGTTVQVDGGAD